MRIDATGAAQFLAYADGDSSFSAVWEHPAYELAREHAELLGGELTREDVERAVAGENTAFSELDGFEENRERIRDLLEHVEANEEAWREQIEGELKRVTPEESLSEITLYLAIGYTLGLGLGGGAYTNLNEPLFLDHPRQLLYMAIHECSHVVYERVHGAINDVLAEQFVTRAGQQEIFATVFHTEAYATYTPLRLREAEGAVGEHDHPVSNDYRVLADEQQLADLVAAYDRVREQLQDGPVDDETLLTPLFREPRLPYRVGCRMVREIEQREGMDAVTEAFYLGGEEFLTEYDWLLDEYRAK